MIFDSSEDRLNRKYLNTIKVFKSSLEKIMRLTPSVLTMISLPFETHNAKV